MLDIKRVLKAAPTKMRSREPLRQLWTPWGERIEHEWLSSRAGNKAFTPSEEGERKLAEGRTPILDEHPRRSLYRVVAARRFLSTLVPCCSSFWHPSLS